MKATPLKTKDDVQKAFLQLLESYKRSKTQILTKEELARDEQNRKLVAEVASHSPQSIVKGLADLQLELGVSVETLSKRLQAEIKTLEDLRAAIQVQQGNLQETLNAKEAANALHILKQEQAQRLQQLEEEQKKAVEKLETESTERRAAWAKSQTEFDQAEADYKANLEKTRQKEAEDYAYALNRKQQLEQDEYDNRKKLLVRGLEESQKTKDAAWAERETVLTSQQADLDKYKQKVDNLEKEIEEKSNSARGKAIKQVTKECEEAFALLEREVAGKQKVAELQAQNLDTAAAQQKAEIEKLSAELKEALAQVQQLSLKALETNKK